LLIAGVEGAAMLAAASSEEIFRSLLLSLAIVLLLGKIAAGICRRVGQPAVIGEILVGIALGPSLLGQLPGDLNERLLPEGTLPYLRVVAQVGIVLFMFVIGLEVDTSIIRRSGRRALTISLSSISVPFVLGLVVLSRLLYSDGAGVDADGVESDFLPFAFFMGLAICGTAFAVLARILAERNMFKIQIGSLLVACAAIDDIVGFSLLAIGVTLAEGGAITRIFVVMGLLLLQVLVLHFLVRPIMDRLVTRHFRSTKRLESHHLGYIFVGLLLSSFTSSLIGLNELIGAFFFGLFFPRDGLPDFMTAVADRVEGVSVHLFLPVFFVVAGQGVSIDGLTGKDLLFTMVIISIAMFGKMLGGSVSSRATGFGTRQALAVGALMNTRGLAELVILQVARSAGVINDRVYTMFVITAIVTTVLSGPLLRLVYPDRFLERDIAEEERNATQSRDRFLVVIPSDERNRESVLTTALVSQKGVVDASITLVSMTSGQLDLEATANNFAVVQRAERRFVAEGIQVKVITRHTNAPADDLITIIHDVLPQVVVQHGLADDLVGRISEIGPDVVIPTPDIDLDAFDEGVECVANETSNVELGLRLALGAERGIRIGGETRQQATARRELGLGDVGAHPLRIGPSESEAIRVVTGARTRRRITDLIDTWKEAPLPVNPLFR
jgi:Kef-type K+ transport system membrane component KefB